ncbi:MAG: light-harvesting antenna LH1, alpha subunit [Pseudomonadota bacterium]
MWRIWLLFDPRRSLIGMVAFLAVLAFSIHFIVLSTDRFNWIEGPSASVLELDSEQAVAQRTASLDWLA